jgi:P pilus assembly chaperone PapD
MRISSLLFYAILSVGGMGSTLASATTGIYLGGTRLIFDGEKEAASLAVNNSSPSDVWLMRFWVSAYGDETAEEQLTSKQAMPFVVTPPLYRLDPQSAVQLRVNKVSDSLPADRESVFYLNSLAIPPKKGELGYEKSVKNGLQFAINTRIKLLYRPAALQDKATVKALPEQLTVSATEHAVVVKNPTPYYITLVQPSLGGKAIQTDIDMMLAPFGTLSLPSKTARGNFRYQTIDDNGATTPIIEKQL